MFNNFKRLTYKEYVEEKKERLTNTLLYRVEKYLKFRKIYDVTLKQSELFSRIINKYTKENKSQKEIKRFKERQLEIIDDIYSQEYDFYIDLVDIMKEIIEFSFDLFKDELNSIDFYLEFDDEDYVFVKGVTMRLSNYSLETITKEIVFNIINESIREYLKCLEEDENYDDFIIRAKMTKKYGAGEQVCQK